jgi:hypothetical protein
LKLTPWAKNSKIKNKFEDLRGGLLSSSGSEEDKLYLTGENFENSCRRQQQQLVSRELVAPKDRRRRRSWVKERKGNPFHHNLLFFLVLEVTNGEFSLSSYLTIIKKRKKALGIPSFQAFAISD